MILAMFRLRSVPVKAVLCLSVLLCLAYGDILWDTCEGPADHPSIKEGNFFNLCIKDHVFKDETHAWTFTRSTISDTLFDGCAFQNTDAVTSNFTLTNWNTVEFLDCRFGAFNEEPMIFDKIGMSNVLFKDCIFHNTANLNFSQFQFNNVTFEGCQFQSDTNFELGEMNTVRFDDCQFQRSQSAMTRSGDDALRFRQITARDFLMIDSNVVNPLRLEGVAGADMAFNDTSINEFWCHSVPEKKDKTIKYYSGFNDTAFQAVTFSDNVNCDETTWKGFFMGNVTFNKNAYFQNSKILDLYWDEVEMVSKTKETLKLDFSKTYIKRRVLANTTILGTADFEDAIFETVFIENFNATKPNFEGAQFRNQEFVDGYCCSTVCVSLKCMCNITEPSGECPAGRSNVNVSATDGCFPAGATVKSYDGLVVRMEDLAIAEKIAIGGGEHSDVFFFGHRSSEHTSEFVSIQHSGSNGPLRISPNHYLYVDGKLRTARSVRPGHRLRGADGEDTLFVLNVKREELRGLYAPTSMHGELLVDGIVVSSYTDVMHPGLAHKLLHPLRLLYRYGFDSLVARFTALHERSFAHVPRALGIPHGPQAIEN